MKKRISLLFMLFFLLGCEAANSNILFNNEINDIKSSVILEEKGILLSIKEESLSSFGATLLLKNDTEYDLYYGQAYDLEVMKENDWYKVNGELFFNASGNILEPGEETIIYLNWVDGYGSLTKGKYRIIKKVNLIGKNIHDTFFIGTEFIID